jgi:hypothetical protein
MTLLPIAMLVVLDSASATEVGSRQFGLGVVLGDPTGISAKYYLGGPTNAVDVALAFDTFGNETGWFYLHATYLIHPSVLAKPQGFEMPWHVGIGGFVSSDEFRNTGDRDRIGVRAPIGLDFNLDDYPLQFFGDIALRLEILPGTDVDFDVGIGGRYYF